jgi:lysozyme
MVDTVVTVQEFAGALIQVFEGCKLHSYQDPGGVWTIGYGHTAGVVAGQTITQAQADAFLAEDAAPLFATAARALPLMSVLEQAAYVSFGFNCGLGAMQLVIDGHDLISNPKYTADRRGVVLPGLVARRRLEETLIAYAQQERAIATSIRTGVN